MSIAEKLTKVAENVPKVYKAGQKSMVDESKIIEKTVSGSVISLDDVSEVPHEVSVQLSSDTVTDFSGVAVNVFGKNIFSNVVTSSVANPLTKINSTTYSLTPNMADGKIYGIRADVSTLPLEIGDVLKCSVKSISKIGASYGWRVEYQDGTFNSVSNSLNATLTVNKPFKALLLYCDMGSAGFSYEPVVFTDVVVYKESEVRKYTANADGVVKAKSISPYMTMLTDTAGINISATYHKSFGMQAEYDRFWDALQQNGSRTDYQGAFYGSGWNNETFKPKYDIKPSGRCGSLFYDSDIKGDLVQILENLGISLDLSEVTRFSYGFYYNTLLTRIGAVNLSKTDTTTSYVFADCIALETIDKITVSENTIFSNWFYNCNALKEIRFEGTIGKSLDIHWSTKLSADSYSSIFLCLSETVTGQTLTVPANARDSFDKEIGVSGAWDMVVETITNWTIAYV